MTVIHRQSVDYIRETTPKNLIVLHYTGGGSLAGAEAQLAIKDYVNVHYAIDRDGQVYQYFDEKFWAYHTGTNLADAKRSIGIEIVCWGQLHRIADALFTWTDKKVVWDEVYHLKPFRGYEYFHRLTHAQETSVAALVADIMSRKAKIKVCTHAQMVTI
jgi:N-acetyl-anhydromuramyl-L-alanine amidase AmpD